MARRGGKARQPKSTRSRQKKVSRKDGGHMREYGEAHPLNDVAELSSRLSSDDESGEVAMVSEPVEEIAVEEEKTDYERLLESTQLQGYAAAMLSRLRREQEGVESESSDGDVPVSVADADGPSVKRHAGPASSAIFSEKRAKKSHTDKEPLASTGKKGEVKLSTSSIQSAPEGDEVAYTGVDYFADHFSNEPNAAVGKETADAWRKVEATELGHQLECNNVSESLCKPIKSLSQLKLQGRLVKAWQCTRPANAEAELTAAQAELLSPMSCYVDVLSSVSTQANGSQLMEAYCLHALNHIYRTQARIHKNNEKAKAGTNNTEETSQDQGFTRPSVLFLLPFRNSAYRLVSCLLQLHGTDQKRKEKVANRKRFEDQFKGEEEDEEAQPTHKPDDYRQLFDGNVNDCFVLGISFRRSEVKLFANLYRSDIIIASPLGLRMLIGSQGDKKYEYDFLSSIEIAILDQTDVFLMQNWDHVMHIFDHLNMQPKQTRDMDIARLRPWYANLQAKYYRQTIVLSEILTPEINALIGQQAHNYAGKVRITKTQSGSIGQVAHTVQQVFLYVDSDSYAKSSESRFDYFLSEVLPGLRSTDQGHTAIFVSSYLSYVQLRNYFKKNDVSSTYICEYTMDKDCSRARSYFYHGERKFLLFTERFHFFRRYRLRGIQHIFFYELPLYPRFYSEIVNFMEAREDVTCTALYTKYDLRRLQGIVGTGRGETMLQSTKKAHMFC